MVVIVLSSLLACTPFYSSISKSYDQTILEILRDHYKQLDEIDLDQYLPKSINPNTIPFILPDIRSWTSSETRLNVSEVLSSVKYGTRLAIIGKPGVGKSTLARHVTKQWAKGLLLQKFSAFFHICLGRTTSPIMDLRSLLKEECHGLIHETDFELSSTIDEIIVTKGEQVMFIVDGFDEYDIQNHKEDYLIRLIKNKTMSLSKSAIILTSRHRRISEIKRHFNEIVEIIGFNKADIDTVLFSLDPQLQSKIGSYFENNPNVEEMCYLPLHMTMVIYLASLNEGSLSDIETETEIYTRFLYLTVNHYSERHGLVATSLDDCFEHSETDHTLCLTFRRVCELAFNATIHKKQTFDSNDIRKTVIQSSTLEDLSLFHVKRVNKEYGPIDLYYFSHQTFKDFMSACYLAVLSESEQQQMIMKYGNVLMLRDLVWKFFFWTYWSKNRQTNSSASF